MRDLLGAEASDEDVRAIVERAEGLPLFLEELARAWASGEPTLPLSIEGTLRARLDSLSEPSRRALRAASVFGERFRIDGACAVLGVDASEVGVLFDQLVLREVLVASGGQLAFRSALLRDTAYAMFSEEDRRSAHFRAAGWLESCGEPDAVRLARHFDEGGAPDRAVRWWLRAAERALAGSDLGAALDFAERGRRATSEAELSIRFALVRAEAHYHRKEMAEAERCAKEALDIAEPGSDFAYRAAAAVIGAAGQHGNNVVVRDVAQTLSSEAHPSEAAAMALARAVSQLVVMGDRGLAAQLRGRLEALVGPGAAPLSPDVRAHVRRAMASYAFLERNLERASRELELGIDAYESISDVRGAAFARTGLASTLLWLGEIERAEAVGRRAIADATRAGSAYMADWARYSRAKALLEAGEHEAALRELEHVAAAMTDSPRIVAGALVYASLAESALERWESARERAREALSVAKTPAAEAGAHAALSRALLGAGHRAEAREASQAAYAIIEKLGMLEEFESLVRAAHAAALEASGERERATEVVRAARELLVAAAERIESATLRESFLSRPRETAYLMRCAREWIDARST